MGNSILTKSGRPVVPPSMFNYVIDAYHKSGEVKSHFGMEKTYAAVKHKVYWPNMFTYIRNYVSSCETCQECKATQQLPKAELVPLIVPNRPMHFILIDIAYLDPDDDGFRYILLNGCVVSKFIVAVPLQSQTASAISQAIQMKYSI